MVRRGFSVCLFEQKEYPHHKVCGEYISNEVRPYLQSLDLFPSTLKPKEIKHFQLSSLKGTLATCAMELGGFGISRYGFDSFLAQRAVSNGVELYTKQKVVAISYLGDAHEVVASDRVKVEAKVVIGAYGRRSKLNGILERNALKKRSKFIGIKHHFNADFPDDVVALHSFEGGYCGLSKVESGAVNVCFLAQNTVFDKYKSIEEIENKLLTKNPHLKEFFRVAEPVFDPLVISQINFGMQERVAKHVLMCGDTAGLIHPLCGNGMAMGIHAAKLVAESVTLFLNGKLSRKEMEQHYSETWRSVFAYRLKFGRYMQRLLERDAVLNGAAYIGKQSPALLRHFVKQSHGKPF